MDVTLLVVAIIAATPPTIMAILTWRRFGSVSHSVSALRIEVNHRLTELIEQAGEVGRLEGLRNGREGEASGEENE